ncbi:uncharacterized protein LOC123554054 isoform X2 [Mercenaria mercenaria]|uniref:uncharacterized protein LOC123554054 isoform X2 n=1 Tax=Mercenaria mercenaria TaxID=6596 RepID=UPI001E1D5E32|nr:uncharacterized protein LOC123554054 isoform X2 [Mercenaria mercenaria]
MPVSIKRKFVSFGYICVHMIYISISLFVYGTYFAERFALFTVIRDRLGGNGTQQTKEEVSGYLYEFKVSTCLTYSTNSGCSVVNQDISFFVAHVLYVELVGKDVGFNWKHLSPIFYVGFVNAVLTAFLSIVFIFLVHKRGRYYVEKNGLAFVKYENSKSEGTGDRSAGYRCTDGQSIPMSDMSLSNIYRRIEDESYINDIGRMVKTLWNPENVGFGRDAKGLHHSSINITKVASIGNESVFQDYLNKRKQIENDVFNLGTKLISPGKFPRMRRPIQTYKFVKNQSCLGKLLNRNINEYYMFHGTPVDNLEQIERTGIELNKFRFSKLGRGIYFSEDPVKADQYTGKGRDRKDELCCILVCRVLLGNSVIIRRNVHNHTVTSQATSAPCKTCLKPEPDCQCSESTKFDSVIFEGVLFRDFVVYETCSCFPEFAIMYTRVH